MDGVRFQPGDKLWYWFDTGMGAKQVVVTLIRENRNTYTVLNSWDEKVLVAKARIEGKVDWDE